ncbi:MAG: sigma factor-like helix-turn-helix DNA-binding protein, partial [Candidatus Riflebacteria bacterium]|nr:sigma factor-like helix-turn-helix DNA-binding protein [Candidatus Riflebacteria bacterium]
VVGKYTAEELLKNLTSDERLLVELRVFQGVPFSEISELTGEMETTLRSRFFRILSRLRVKKNI